jgi:putative flippase GtrA
MYTDSVNDLPLIEVAEEGILVKRNKLYNYYEYKPNFIIRFWRWGWGVYHKNEELWNYLIVGGLTTIVNMGVYFTCTNTFCDPQVPVELQIANVVSWIVAVLFAYVTNRIFVFKSKSKGKEKFKEFTSFVGMRVLSLGMDMAGMALMVSLLSWNDAISKIIVQVIVVLSNYIFSKVFVFKKKD